MTGKNVFGVNIEARIVQPHEHMRGHAQIVARRVKLESLASPGEMTANLLLHV